MSRPLRSPASSSSSTARVLKNTSPEFLRALLLSNVMAGGCARIIPPSDLEDPATIYIANYGRHTSLILPTGEGMGIEYTYGDWRYYALHHRKWHDGVRALFFSNHATLGRRSVPTASGQEAIRQRLGAVRLTPLEVESALVRDLVAQLDRRYSENRSIEVYNDQELTHFVRIDANYGFFNNSNHQTARWLAALGCEVKGSAIFPDFRVK